MERAKPVLTGPFAGSLVNLKRDVEHGFVVVYEGAHEPIPKMVMRAQGVIAGFVLFSSREKQLTIKGAQVDGWEAVYVPDPPVTEVMNQLSSDNDC